MACYPDVLSALYSNAEAVCAITRQGQEERHFRARQQTSGAESMTSGEFKFNQKNHEPHSLTTRVGRNIRAANFLQGPPGTGGGALGAGRRRFWPPATKSRSVFPCPPH